MTGVIARPMAELPGSRPSRTGQVVHAVCDQQVKVGFIMRPARAPLCGAPVRLAAPEPGLFPAVVTCHACLAIARAENIEIGVNQ